jgi:hypothetical protein
MDVNDRGVENVDEAWILKYRAALKNAPVEQPGLRNPLQLMRAWRTKVVAHINQMLLPEEKPKLGMAAKPIATIPVGEPEQELKAS